MLTFIESSDLNFFASGVADDNFTIAFANVKEFTFTSLGLPLFNDVSVRGQKFIAHSLNDARQEIVHPFIDKVYLVRVDDSETALSCCVFGLISFTDNLSDCISNRLVSLPENADENFTLNRDSQRFTDLVKEVIQLVLRCHSSLDLEEVIANLRLQLL